MKRKRFTKEQIIGILKEADAGAAVLDVCRRHGMSSATFYAWKSKYGGLEVSETKRLRSLEDEPAAAAPGRRAAVRSARIVRQPGGIGSPGKGRVAPSFL